MIIKEMEEKDFPGAMECYLDGIKSKMCTFNDTIPSFNDWDKAHFTYGRYVAIKDDKVVGFCCLQPFALPKFYHGVVEESIYLRNGYQGQGIGKLLIEKLIKDSEEHGCWTLVAHVMSINTNSIKFHQKMGFRIVGERIKLAKNKDGVWLNTVLMEKRSDVIE